VLRPGQRPPFLGEAAQRSGEVRELRHADVEAALRHRPPRRPGGAPETIWDARFDTPLTDQNIINGAVINALGIANAKVIVPRDLSHSIMYLRATNIGTIQMPPLAKNVVDANFAYALAEWIEHKAADRARNAIAGLMALAPDEAEVRGADSQWRRVPAAEVAVGEVVRVRPGERVPLDGTVLAGTSTVDQASVTGESIPVDKAAGDAVFAATVNQGGELELRVTAAAGHTTLDRIVESVERAQASRAPTQRFIERFAAFDPLRQRTHRVVFKDDLVTSLFFELRHEHQ